MQAFIDESESRGQQFVFAGFIGAAEHWAAFADRWQAVLKQAPAVEKFKFYDFDQRAASFSASRLSEMARKRRVSQLIGTMSGAGFIRISITLGIPGFAEMSAAAWTGFELAIPYGCAFQLIIAAVAFDLLARGYKERFEIIFDEHLILGPKAKRWYPLIRELCVSDEVRSILPVDPIFKTDDDSLALQAADLYAGLVRSGKGERNAARDAILSPLLVILSATRVTRAEEMRAQAEWARRIWDNITNSIGIAAAAEGFAPIVRRLKKNMNDIGGESIADRTLAPIFAATDSIKAADDPDGYDWSRQELAEVTVLSKQCQNLFVRTEQEALEDAMHRYGIAREELGRAIPKPGLEGNPGTSMPDEELNRAVALLDEGAIGAYRRKLAKRREHAARKATRHK